MFISGLVESCCARATTKASERTTENTAPREKSRVITCVGPCVFLCVVPCINRCPAVCLSCLVRTSRLCRSLPSFCRRSRCIGCRNCVARQQFHADACRAIHRTFGALRVQPLAYLAQSSHRFGARRPIRQQRPQRRHHIGRREFGLDQFRHH